MIVLFAFIGLAVGSFLNLCIDRLPRGESIIHPPSHCEACNERLGFFDLVPVFSYIWLRGRCRYCGTALPKRLPIAELATGLIFALLFWKYGLSPQFVMGLVYASLLIIIFVIDLEHGLILNKVVYPAMVLALIFSSFWPGIGSFWPEIGVVNSLLGGAVALGFILIPFLIYPGGIGGGDIKLATFGGLATGFPQAFIAIFIGALGGGLVALFLLISGIKGRREAIPFGPFLSVGIMAALLWGPVIVDWYLGFF